MRLFRKKPKKASTMPEVSARQQASLGAEGKVECSSSLGEQCSCHGAVVARLCLEEPAGHVVGGCEKLGRRRGQRSLTWSSGSVPGTVAVEICGPPAHEEPQAASRTAWEPSACERTRGEGEAAGAEGKRFASPRSAWRRRSPSGSSRSRSAAAGQGRGRAVKKGRSSVWKAAKAWWRHAAKQPPATAAGAAPTASDPSCKGSALRKAC